MRSAGGGGASIRDRVVQLSLSLDQEQAKQRRPPFREKSVTRAMASPDGTAPLTVLIASQGKSQKQIIHHRTSKAARTDEQTSDEQYDALIHFPLFSTAGKEEPHATSQPMGRGPSIDL